MSRWSRVLAAFALAVFSTVVYSTAFQDATPPFVVRTLPPSGRQGAGVVDEEAEEGYSRGLGRGFNVRSFVAKTQPPPPSAAARQGRSAAVSEAATAPLSDQRSQHAVVLVDVPHGGGRSVACTFGSLQRWVGVGAPVPASATSGAAQLRDRVELVSVGEGGGLRRALETPSGFGVQKGVLHVAPNATYVVVFPLRHPVDRVVASFVAGTHGAGWPCAGGLPGYGGAESTRSEGRQQRSGSPVPVTCEEARNVLLKRLLGLPAGEPATARHLEKAKALLRSERLVIGNEEDLPKTMEHLRSALGRPAPMRYYTCTAYQAPPEPSRSVRDALYDENRLDVQLYEAARHRFYTGFAGRFEELYTAPAAPCLPPHACWDDELKPDGRRAEPRVKPFASARFLKSPHCAAQCTT
eukprot:Rhum_TRINITY_DN1399_c0_g1::Rhum_TRINITY_DN1399_c0_g1_i1::g.4000::m.4000